MFDFDTVAGLPVHILVIHAAVVLLPLMALVTIAFTVRPRWRPGLPWAVLGNLVALGAAYAAKESGEMLQARLTAASGEPVAVDHGTLGSSLPYFALGMLAASVIAYLLVGRTTRVPDDYRVADGPGIADDSRVARRASTPVTVLAVVVVLVAGVASTTWTYRVGDSGSKAVWEDTIANTEPPAGG
jgi:hypothetical protein